MLHQYLFDLSVAFVFLAMVTVLVFAHELGHYLFARLFGMGVEEFAIGYGVKPLFVYGRRKYRLPLTDDETASWENGELRTQQEQTGAAGLVNVLERGENVDGELFTGPEGSYLEETTRFTVRPFPIGGFVRIKGMMPEEDGSETRIPGGFYSKPPWQRLVVLFAGPLFSVLTGLFVLIPLYMVAGITKPDNSPVIQDMVRGKAADRAHLQAGDRILSLNGKSVSSFYDVISTFRDLPGKEVKVEYERDGAQHETVVIPDADSTPSAYLGPDLMPTGEMRKQAKVGLVVPSHQVKVGLHDATIMALDVPFTTISGLMQGVKNPGKLKDSVGGPETMIKVTAAATQSSFGAVVELLAVLSISIGIFNLLPFPPLDGGQMVMSFAELIRGGRRLSMKAQGLVVTLGISVVLMMVLSVVYIDFRRPSLEPQNPDIIRSKNR